MVLLVPLVLRQGQEHSSLALSHPLLSSSDALLAKDSACSNKQRSHIASQKPHVLSLHTGHSEQVLSVCEVCVELC